MKHPASLKKTSLALGLVLASVVLIRAQDMPAATAPDATSAPAAAPAPPPKPAAKPAPPPAAPRTPETASTVLDKAHQPQRGLNRESQIATANKGHNPQVILIGDSITEFYNKGVWAKNYGKYDGCTYGFSGENTENILSHIADGILAGINPKVAILLIGTNNLGHNAGEKPEWVAAGITAIVASIHEKLPTTKVLVLGIFPRGSKAGDPMRARVKAVNDIVSKLDNGDTTRYIDIGTKFLLPNGDADKTMLGDWLHPTAQGDQAWADAIQPLLDQMMGAVPGTPSTNATTPPNP